MDKKKTIKTVALVGGAAIGSFILYRIVKTQLTRNKIADNSGDGNNNNNGSGGGSGNSGTTYASINFPIKVGDKGDKVHDVQVMLNRAIVALGHPENKIDEDGVFGNQTKEALMRFQIAIPMTKSAFAALKNYVIQHNG